MICGDCAGVADATAGLDLSLEHERRFIEVSHRELCAGPGCTCQHRVIVPVKPVMLLPNALDLECS